MTHTHNTEREMINSKKTTKRTQIEANNTRERKKEEKRDRKREKERERERKRERLQKLKTTTRAEKNPNTNF